MFLRKLFSSDQKFVWVIVDLFVVIVGVYCAFLIQNSAAAQKDKKEQTKIYSALKMELEAFRVGFPQFARSNMEFLEKIENQDFTDISSWRFIEPQYGYQIIEYAISIQNTEIIDFTTYEALQKLYVNIKQLEHTERLITELAGAYQYMIPELDEDHPLNLERKANNRSRMFRFRMFLKGRAANLERTSENANQLLKQINEDLGPELKAAIDRKYISENIGWIKTEEQAIGMVQQYFPEISPEEIGQLYREARGLPEPAATDTIPAPKQ